MVICGAGTMGTGIAYLAASAGYRVLLYDSKQEALEKSRLSLGLTLDQGVAKGKLSVEKQEAIRSLVIHTGNFGDCRAEFCLEAVSEEPSLKGQLFRQLMELNGPDAVYATNTSSLSVTKMAKMTPFPGRLAGMHFFNPAPVMKLVEVVHTPMTEREVVLRITALARAMNKIPVQSADTPGFIVNRVARPFYLESLLLAEQQVTDFTRIDRLLESTGFPMGPFALTDLIGQDINLTVSQSLFAAFGKAPRFRPSELQRQKVKQGELGRKTGKGFYLYPAGDLKSPN